MKKLAIIDTFALLHRAWHAIPNLTTKDGRMVNAAYGFSAILLKLINDIKPDYLVAAFDLPHETFRHKAFKEYKAHREAPDKDFIQQIDLVEEILRALSIPVLAVPEYEADDIIGSLACHFYKADKNIEVIIVSGDLDTLQLINDRIRVFTMRKGITDTIIYDEKAVYERYGISPRHIIDMKAIAGDTSDNIPGVKGIGQKGAIGLIQEFGSLENIYTSLESPKLKPRVKELLKTQQKEAEQSKLLATIVTDLPIQLDINKAATHEYDLEKISELFQKLEFRSLLAKLPKLKDTAEHPAPLSKKLQSRFEIIDTEEGMQKLALKLQNIPVIAIDTETTGLNPLEAKMLGASFSWEAGKAIFVHARTRASHNAFQKILGPILANPAIKKIGHNIKYDIHVLNKIGVSVNGIGVDTLIAAYLVYPERSLKLEDLAFTYAGIKMQNLQELAERTLAKEDHRKNKIRVEKIPPNELAAYGAEDAAVTLQLSAILEQDLKNETLDKLFHSIEMPLIPVLHDMEARGIMLDTKYLKKIEKDFAKKIESIEQAIFKHAGSSFNIGSPLQLKEVLFEKLNIASAGIKRKKTGLSTAASELDKLMDAHPIIPHISEWREVTKLMNTYVTTLPLLVDNNSRVHTSFNQTIAATGRLSSTDPNLQNIPIRTELGRAIRKAFIAPPGYKLISADYSQIELRLAAIISKDKKMLASFTAGEDIHRRTAAEIYEIPLEKVSSDQRRKAKEVNFGVLYGLGSLGLSQRTGMSRMEAKQFIERYFQLYQGVKQYVEDTKTFAREHGYVETLFGRKRKLPEIYSSAPMLVAQAERMAVNMPLQGTAADIIKQAMIKIHPLLQKLQGAHMLLQVHDELVFEVAESEISKAVLLITKAMEDVTHYPIPLVVDVKVGSNWIEMTPYE